MEDFIMLMGLRCRGVGMRGGYEESGAGWGSWGWGGLEKLGFAQGHESE